MEVNRTAMMSLLNVDGDVLDDLVGNLLPRPHRGCPCWEEVDPDADPDSIVREDLWYLDDPEVELCFHTLRGRKLNNKDIQVALKETKESRKQEVYDPWGGSWNIGRPW